MRILFRFRNELLEYLRAQGTEILDSLAEEKKFTDETTDALVKAIEAFKTQFATSA